MSTHIHINDLNKTGYLGSKVRSKGTIVYKHETKVEVYDSLGERDQ